MQLSPWQWFFCIVVLDVTLILLLLVWRQIIGWHKRGHQRFIKQWKPVLMAYSMDIPPPKLPALPNKERLVFLMLWNDTQQKLVGSASPRLNKLLQDLELEAHVLTCLNSKRIRTQIVACQTLGHLENVTAAWPKLVELSFGPHDMLSFFALQALVQMSPEAALPVLLEVMQKTLTSKSRLLGLFRRYPSPALVNPLIESLQKALYSHNMPQALNIIDLLEVLPYPSILPTMRQILVEATDVRLIIGCLQVMGDLHDPWSLGLSLPFLNHTQWEVRQAAVKALGKVSQAAQIPLLLESIDDHSAWVAQEAIEALFNLPGIKPEKLLEISLSHSNARVRRRLQNFLESMV